MWQLPTFLAYATAPFWGADFEWMQTARVFLIDAYEPPVATRQRSNCRSTPLHGP
jgi:hypothetical protein